MVHSRGLAGPRPRQGPLSMLLSAADTGELTEEEVFANMVLLLAVGQESLTGQLGNGLLTLLRNRDQFEQLRSQPMLVADAVEEVLRPEPPVQYTGRRSLTLKSPDAAFAPRNMCCC